MTDLAHPSEKIQLKPTLLLLTHWPNHSLTALALTYVQTFAEQWLQKFPQTEIPLQIFLYHDAVYLANRLTWLPVDQLNLTRDWQNFAKTYHLTVQVCVSVALSRGITDMDNAARHRLQGDNLAENFNLVGLGELAMYLHKNIRLLQF